VSFVAPRSRLRDVAARDEDRRSIEHQIEELKESLAQYEKKAADIDSETVADLARAVHDIGDHLLDVSRRVKRMEDSQEEWTVRGWDPPPGSDPGPAA
jgi:hypothetical protein